MPSRPKLIRAVTLLLLKPNHNLSVCYFGRETDGSGGLMHPHAHMRSVLVPVAAALKNQTSVEHGDTCKGLRIEVSVFNGVCFELYSGTDVT